MPTPLSLSAFLCGLGGAVLIATVLWRLGALGLYVGVFTIVAGIGWFLSAIAREFNQDLLPCPTCREGAVAPSELAVVGVASCRKCTAYCHRSGDGKMLPLPDGHEASKPVFEAPLPYGDVCWATGCAVCGQTPCELERIAGADRELSVPLCSQHREAEAALLRRSPATGDVVLRFRSHRAARRFRALNPR